MPVPEPIAAGAAGSVAIDVVIPALDEERSLPLVLADLPRPPVRRVVVADNGSADGTARVAAAGGAVVVAAPRRGYGSACLAALDYLRRHQPPDIVVFVDADYSDHPEELPRQRCQRHGLPPACGLDLLCLSLAGHLSGPAASERLESSGAEFRATVMLASA